MYNSLVLLVGSTVDRPSYRNIVGSIADPCWSYCQLELNVRIPRDTLPQGKVGSINALRIDLAGRCIAILYKHRLGQFITSPGRFITSGVHI